MQLKIQRSQRAGGITGGTVYFCLDVRADYTPEEKENISKYRLGGELIYSSAAARKHAENAGEHFEKTQAGSVAQRAAGLARLPKRVQLGQCRVGWIEQEVLDWLQERITRRDQALHRSR